MKYFLICTLFLIGCVSNTPLPVENPTYPAQIAIGFDTQISWACEQQEINPMFVWIECYFKYQEKSGNSSKVCIEIAYFENDNGKLVTSSDIQMNKPFCSGFLKPGEESVKYVIFTKEERKKLDSKCGPNLSNCVMLTSKYNNSPGSCPSPWR